ncbi:hypothetical protein DDW44_23750 [Streptomyces tirandamycinicus]|uniref:MFS transporter n=2 Tax=Streptomyces TaxID=1883 RepID=A0A2S1SYE1_9ACTN|nr:hypothetical protein DDW44_23750 [Streptomyces tirandamycinicus]
MYRPALRGVRRVSGRGGLRRRGTDEQAQERAAAGPPGPPRTAGPAHRVRGPLLTGFALAGILGGLLYGLRTWPGGPERHSVLLLYATVAATGAMAAAPSVGALGALLLLAGLCQAVVLAARNLSLQRALPASHPVGYSLQYAGSGIGYGISASATGFSWRTSGPRPPS